MEDESGEGELLGGQRCPECSEVVDWEYLDKCDEKWGGEVICPHCGAYWE